MLPEIATNTEASGVAAILVAIPDILPLVARMLPPVQFAVSANGRARPGRLSSDGGGSDQEQ